MHTPAERSLPARLFGGERGPFRHHLGLARCETRDFYAPTDRATELRAEKEAVLSLPDAALYGVASPAGWRAVEEFAAGLPSLAENAALPAGPERHRAIALALEPDVVLLSAPDACLTWASVCFPTRWSLEGKLGQPLTQIHSVVPRLNEELGRKVGQFFARMKPGEGWSRANWGLSASGALNQHPTRPHVELTAHTPPDAVFVRIEAQHLVRLPDTGAIAFGIRVVNFPLPAILADPDLAAGLRNQLRTMPADVAAYKGIPADYWQRL